jgi:SAM-dependent methyltransferase
MLESKSIAIEEVSSDTIEALEYSKALIREIAMKRAGTSHLLTILVVQAWTEFFLRVAKRINFRKRSNTDACRAYVKMSSGEFAGINARQRWANWRVIPKNLNGVQLFRPIVAIDLCCGVGHSTEVLACYLPESTKILGLEYSEVFVVEARKRRFYHQNGKTCDTQFRAQSVLEPFHWQDGQKVKDGEVSLVNSSGAVGCHFSIEETRILVTEIARVLKQGGIAMIDSGAAGTCKKDLIDLFKGQGFSAIKQSKSSIFDKYTQVCFVKE